VNLEFNALTLHREHFAANVARSVKGVLLPAYDALVAYDDVVWRGRMGDFSAIIRSFQGSSHSDAQCAPCAILKHPPLGNCLGSPTPERRVMSERL
jgi:hypothetical protein